MKAKIKISVMLMAMIIGTLAASAQSASRGTTHEDSKRKTSSTEVRKAEKAHRGTQQVPSRTSTKKDPQSKTQVTTRTSTKKSPNYMAPQSRTQVTTRTTVTKTQNNRTPQQRNTRAVEQRQTQTVQHRTTPKTSTTNRYNPKSNYREANRTVHVGNTYKDPKSVQRTNNNSHVTTVHHSDKHINRNERHYQYYPHKKVKISVHPVTYRNHYKVAYYPAHRDIIWTRSMHRSYYSLYPSYTAWHYPVGYRVQTVSAFEAKYNMGEVSRVYGRVYATWYNRETDDLLLFFGGEYPQQEFTMVVPGRIARKYSWKPERYFLGQHVYATGLITSFEGKAEMVVKKKYQLDVY